ncbi:GNAT family N-acetyltransferase [bacterium]|nr:GNAT family N-acetyltransferase [bacterium]
MAEQTSLILDPLRVNTLSEFTRLMKRFFEELNIVPEFHRYDQDIAAPMVTYAPPRAGLWFARVQKGQPAVGLAGVRSLANRTCELKRFYVVPEERHKGYGQFLLNQAMGFARQNEYFEILLSVRPELKDALSLYQRNGFTPCACYNEDRRAGIFFSYKFSNEVK